jgi:hypothetical protein
VKVAIIVVAVLIAVAVLVVLARKYGVRASTSPKVSSQSSRQPLEPYSGNPHGDTGILDGDGYDPPRVIRGELMDNRQEPQDDSTGHTHS